MKIIPDLSKEYFHLAEGFFNDGKFSMSKYNFECALEKLNELGKVHDTASDEVLEFYLKCYKGLSELVQAINPSDSVLKEEIHPYYARVFNAIGTRKISDSIMSLLVEIFIPLVKSAPVAFYLDEIAKLLENTTKYDEALYELSKAYLDLANNIILIKKDDWGKLKKYLKAAASNFRIYDADQQYKFNHLEALRSLTTYAPKEEKLEFFIMLVDTVKKNYNKILENPGKYDFAEKMNSARFSLYVARKSFYLKDLNSANSFYLQAIDIVHEIEKSYFEDISDDFFSNLNRELVIPTTDDETELSILVSSVAQKNIEFPVSDKQLAQLPAHVKYFEMIVNPFKSNEADIRIEHLMKEFQKLKISDHSNNVKKTICDSYRNLNTSNQKNQNKISSNHCKPGPK